MKNLSNVGDKQDQWPLRPLATGFIMPGIKLWWVNQWVSEWLIKWVREWESKRLYAMSAAEAIFKARTCLVLQTFAKLFIKVWTAQSYFKTF